MDRRCGPADVAGIAACGSDCGRLAAGADDAVGWGLVADSGWGRRCFAMKVLRARLYELQQKKKEEEFTAFVGEKKEIGFGSQIRSYVFQPYQMVKDHRTNTEVGNLNAVMDGNLDQFMENYLLQSRK